MREQISHSRIAWRVRCFAAAALALVASAGFMLAISGEARLAGSAWFGLERVPLLELSPDFRVVPSFSNGVQSLGAVSAVSTADGWYSANYMGIVETKRTAEGYSHRPVMTPNDVAYWNPTGLCAGTTAGELFIANYNGHDVLRVMMRKDGTMSLMGRFTHDLMRSPENVACHDGVLYVADYDGGAILAFDVGTGSLLWRTEIPRAHGVCVAAGAIYATSLMTREVLKLDESGRIVKRAGVSGWRPGDYLWPTQITPLHDGTLAVVDAHQGRITILTPDLGAIRCFGGLGAGTNGLNFPYCILARDDGNYIFDTFKERVLRTDNGWKVVEEISLAPAQKLAKTETAIIGTRRNAYSYPMLTARSAATLLGIPGVSNAGFYGGYGGLIEQGVAHARRMTMNLPIDWPLESRCGLTDQWYMTWARRYATARGDVLVMGSPQLRRAWVIDPRTGAFFTTPDAGPAWREDAWKTGMLGTADALPEALLSSAVSKLAAVARSADRSKAWLDALDCDFGVTGDSRPFVGRLARATPRGALVEDSLVTQVDAAPALADYLSDNTEAELNLPQMLALRQLTSSALRDIHALVDCADDAGGSLSKLKDVLVRSNAAADCTGRSLFLKMDEEGGIDRVALHFAEPIRPGSLGVSAIDQNGAACEVSIRWTGDRADIQIAHGKSVQIRFPENTPRLRGFVLVGLPGAITEARISRWMSQANSATPDPDTSKAVAAIRKWAKSEEPERNLTTLATVFQKAIGSGGSARLVFDASTRTTSLAFFDEQRSQWLLQRPGDSAKPLADLRLLNDPRVSPTDAELDYFANPSRYQ